MRQSYLSCATLPALVIIMLMILCHPSSASIEQQSRCNIRQLYHSLKKKPKQTLQSRITFISESFLDKPYLLYALGEGSDATYDQSPLYRTDAFDCETYVDTVIALALSTSLKTFESSINQIRYHRGNVSFGNRNHFTCLDWNTNNEQQGIIKDITLKIHNRKGQSVALFAHAIIDKAAWYKNLSMNEIHLPKLDTITQEKRLASLHAEGAQFKPTRSTIPYIPFSVLFDKKERPNTYLFSQIPNAAIIEIIRPNWNLTQTIGTAMNVSHLGFVIRKNNQLWFREASSTYKKVVDVPLIPYLQEAIKSPTIRGINIHVIIKNGHDN